jgi:hypothetical protein
MSSQAARSEAVLPRLLVTAADAAYDVFEVVEVADGGVIRARSTLLFEVGEELAVRVEHAGVVTSARASVRSHVGPAAAPITELVLTGWPPP